MRKSGGFGGLQNAYRDRRHGRERGCGQVSSRRDYTDESHRVFITRRRVRFREMEYAVPREAGLAVLAEARRAIDASGLRISFPVEIRTAPADDGAPHTLADLTLDPSSRIVRRGEREVPLTRTEFSLLELLVANAGQVLTRELIMDRIWGYDFATSSNSLDVYIGYLRRKTEAEGEPRLIQTVRGVGYVARTS